MLREFYVTCRVEKWYVDEGTESHGPYLSRHDAIADAGLVTCSIRVNVPQEGPRASGKLVRWSRLQVGELSVENQGGHSLVSFQVESQVLRGSDDAADEIAAARPDLIGLQEVTNWVAAATHPDRAHLLGGTQRMDDLHTGREQHHVHLAHIRTYGGGPFASRRSTHGQNDRGRGVGGRHTRRAP